MCFGCSKEPSRCDGSFKYPQHMFWMRLKEINFQIRTLIRRAESFYIMEPYIIIGSDKDFLKRKIVLIFLPINLNMWFGCSKEWSH